ncbi:MULTISPECIES: transketolase [Dermabacter]|uniref:transketolase n=1 Tax=Dermabacter TaxID=36739 RepID=UPI000353E193|nr:MULTISPECIES: transketolase [Dermabacter]EPH14403.1 transketolase [Dermabacter sp. HFH0086]MCT1708353.1 transketolase [Dermabacter hominis]MCT1789836.1 transketolase [Dermabacter hominis]MCT1806718.1 transketolase [Dermabacter hominis]MCT1954777.1 transketolase [Dermabacter hominis]
MSSNFVAPEGWSDLDKRAIDNARILAAEAVQKVGNGHPGTAVSLSPAAYLLYQDIMNHDPKDPDWFGRDRFILSCGHTSLTQYLQLFLGGFGLEVEDLQALRTEGSKTPGHPENFHTAGVEMTTGPLGQGIASSVGFAMAQRRVRGLLDPTAPAGESPFDTFTYVIASDGDLEEGVSHEASSLAGTQQLGNLIVIWDDNEISIEGDTNIAFTEDTAARYQALGWDVRTVDWTNGGTEYVENLKELKDAIVAGQQVTDKPTFIRLRTVIAWPTPGKSGDHAAHGSALGDQPIAGLKDILGFDTEKTFEIDEEALAHARALIERGAQKHREWDAKVEEWRAENPDAAALYDRLIARDLPTDLDEALPVFEADEKGLATRAASGKVLSALAPVLPELWGGSADLAGSNNTTMAGEPSFIPEANQTKDFSGSPYGRTLHFGIREHAMGAILSGISLYGLTRPYGGTFFQFADYMRGSVRLASLCKTPAIYVWTHDSIGLGEDGPTHQPVEHLAAYRAIPNLSIVRPADANETAQAWKAVLKRDEGPAGLILTRQGVPTFDREEYASADNLDKGAYVMKDASNGEPEVILIATGSEVQHAAGAQKLLEAEGIPTRLVSMPCVEWFDEQSEEYRESVLPSTVKARVSVEAGIAMPWYRFLGDAGRAVSLEHYGESASGSLLFEKYGFTAENVAAKAKESLAAARK